MKISEQILKQQMDELAKLREALNLFADPPTIEGTFRLVSETTHPLTEKERDFA